MKKLSSVVSVAGALGLAFIAPVVDWLPGASLVPLGLLAAALLILVERPLPQLLARAIWWATGLVGTAWAFQYSTDHRAACVIASGSALLALLVLGRHALIPRAGLVTDIPAFAPEQATAFFLGTADAAAAGFLALLIATSRFHSAADAQAALGLVGLAAVLAFGLWGLARGKVWGALLSVGAHVVLALGLGAFVASYTPQLAVLFGLSAAVQVTLLLSVTRRLRAGRADQAPHRMWRLAPRAVLLASLAATATAGALLVLSP